MLDMGVSGEPGVRQMERLRSRPTPHLARQLHGRRALAACQTTGAHLQSGSLCSETEVRSPQPLSARLHYSRVFALNSAGNSLPSETAGANHDPDADGNGTTIKVANP
jgi:hypothetical protein